MVFAPFYYKIQYLDLNSLFFQLLLQISDFILFSLD